MRPAEKMLPYFVKKNLWISQSVDETFDGVDVRVYRPKDQGKDEILPALVFFHGGGWVFGSRGTYNC